MVVGQSIKAMELSLLMESMLKGMNGMVFLVGRIFQKERRQKSIMNIMVTEVLSPRVWLLMIIQK